MSISRREAVAGLGLLALEAGVGASAAAQSGADVVRLKLRLLETSDLHMFALDWDYYRGKPDPTVGFAKVATLIANARSEATNSMLFDNGDIIQGNPLGDFLTKPDGASFAEHPMLTTMATAGYDAATLGNHEFNYGLPFLDKALASARFPFTCANLERLDGGPELPKHLILERTFTDESGAAYQLRIGVVGFLPPQILVWDKARLDGKVRVHDILAMAREVVPKLRERCDLIVALSHSGIASDPPVEGGENMSLHLATVPEIDVIMTGHSHRVFPGPDYVDGRGIDARRGTLHGIPAVMPGFWGSHLGVVDLKLVKHGQAWSVESFAVEARPIYRREKDRVLELASDDTSVVASIAPAHEATIRWVNQPVGSLVKPVHTYFVWLGHDPASQIVNDAQIFYAYQLLKELGLADLPVLSAAAPFKAGYKADWYVDLSAGQIAIRDVAELYIYPNTVTAVKINGAQVKDWLEFAARIFHQIDLNGQGAQPLVNTQLPSYNFDQISGVTYEIDVSQPPRFDRDARLINPSAHRIRRLSFEGKPIDPDRQFIVVTNNYRADGGGRFPGLGGAAVVLRAPDTNLDALQGYMAGRKNVSFNAGPWRFAPLERKVRVWIESSPKAQAHLSDVPGLAKTGPGRNGFYQFEIDL